MLVDNARARLKKELTTTLTKLVENSRDTLKAEIAIALRDDPEMTEEVVAKTIEIIDDDCDHKLTLIPGVVKGLIKDADDKANKAALQA